MFEKCLDFAIHAQLTPFQDEHVALDPLYVPVKNQKILG